MNDLSQIDEADAITFRPFEPISWKDFLQVRQREYLIKGWLDKGSMSVIYGEPNTGKTFLALDIAIHIARGVAWCGNKVSQGSVVYIAAEGGIGLQERLKAFSRYHGLSTFPPLFVLPRGVEFCTSGKDVENLIDEICGIGDVSLVVVDTLSRVMAGGNENSSEAMGAFVASCDRIRQATGAHVMVLHHSGKDASKGARGHSLLKAATDTEISLSQSKGVVTATIRKQRDGKCGGQLSLILESVAIGKDDDFGTVSSCVLIPAEGPRASTRQSIREQRALDLFTTCLREQGVSRTLSDSMSVQFCVTEIEFRDLFKRSSICKSDKPDSENRAYRRVLFGLENAGFIMSYGGYLWAPDKPDKPDK